MGLSSKGKISFSDIQKEFSGTNPISLGEYYVKGVSGIPKKGSQLSLSNFRGKSKPRDRSKPPPGYYQGKCNNGYYDATRGGLTWWACGAHCPGGKYRTDLGCNCACFANANDPPQFFKNRFPHLW